MDPDVSKKRLVETSLGQVVIEFWGDGHFQMTLLDHGGWAAKEGEWGDAEIAKGLFYVLGVPEDEAQRVESEVVAEWIARGGDPRGRWDEGSSSAITAAGAGAIALGLLGAVIVGTITIVRTIARWFG